MGARALRIPRCFVARTTADGVVCRKSPSGKREASPRLAIARRTPRWITSRDTMAPRWAPRRPDVTAARRVRRADGGAIAPRMSSLGNLAAGGNLEAEAAGQGEQLGQRGGDGVERAAGAASDRGVVQGADRVLQRRGDLRQADGDQLAQRAALRQQLLDLGQPALVGSVERVVVLAGVGVAPAQLVVELGGEPAGVELGGLALEPERAVGSRSCRSRRPSPCRWYRAASLHRRPPARSPA